MKSALTYRYFVAKERGVWFEPTFAFYAGNDNEGEYFRTNGDARNGGLNKICSLFGFAGNRIHAVETTFKQALKLVDKDCRKKVLKTLGIKTPFSKSSKLTQQHISDMHSLLEKNCAFNGDTALLIEDENILNICEEMEKRGLLHSSPLDSSMFFLSNNYKEMKL